MTEKQFYNSIEDYYKQVNSLEEINSVGLSYHVNEFREKSLNLSDSDKKRIELEIDCLYFLVRNGKVEPMYTREREDGIVESYPNLSSISDEDIEYLKKRIKKTNNIYFKTRFAHIIWVKTKQYDYAKQAADCYFLLAENFEKLDIEKPIEHSGIEICYALWNLQDIVFSINYKIEEFKDFVLNIINNPNKDSSCYLRLQLDCIKILLDKVKRAKLKKEVLKELEDLCQEALNNDLNEFFTVDYLETGEKISQTLKTDSARWVLKQAEYYEGLSNKENPIIAPEYCQKAIDLYKKLNNETKINELYKKYSYLSKSIKLSQYCTDSVDLTPCIKEYEKIAEELSSEEILKFIIYSSDIIPKYNEDKKFIEKQNEQYFLSSFVHTNIIDEYGHIIGKLDTEEDELKHRMYNYCDIWYDMQSKIFSHFLRKTIELKKINAEIVLNFLKNTWYGANIEKELSGGDIYKYNWLQYIGPSIESFFLKFEKFINGDESSILYIQEIDSLSLKIEGMIRDMISLASIDEFQAFYFDRNKNFNWCNINKYLKDSNIFRIIPENDVYFLKYFLTEHRNLRNRVAHSLTFLGEYGIYNMVILFIAILRLSKCLILKREVD